MDSKVVFTRPIGIIFCANNNFFFSTEEVKSLASKMLGQTLVTLQTGAKGKPVHKVFVQERVYSKRELYFAILLDRASGGPVIIGSSQGGVSIEDVARENPEAIVKVCIIDNNNSNMLAHNQLFEGFEL